MQMMQSMEWTVQATSEIGKKGGEKFSNVRRCLISKCCGNVNYLFINIINVVKNWKPMESAKH